MRREGFRGSEPNSATEEDVPTVTTWKVTFLQEITEADVYQGRETRVAEFSARFYGAAGGGRGIQRTSTASEVAKFSARIEGVRAIAEYSGRLVGRSKKLQNSADVAAERPGSCRIQRTARRDVREVSKFSER